MDRATAIPETSEPQPARRRRVGRLLVLANLAAALACTAIVLAVDGVNYVAIFKVLRILTPIGFLYFMAAMLARPLHDLFGNSVTRWLVANRRYLGLSFASWHLVHWPLLTCLRLRWGEKFWVLFDPVLLPAGATLIMITLLAATSFDGAQRLLGRWWSVLHTVGVYMILAWFLRTYIQHTQTGRGRPYMYPFIVLMIVTPPFRWIMTARRWKRA